MSQHTRLFFIRDEQIVGYAPASLGFSGGNYLGAITDGFHLCVEYFDRTPCEFPEWAYKKHEESYGHFFQTRRSLFLYQYVYFTHNRKLYNRDDVHLLVKGDISSKEFESKGVELPKRKLEAIQLLSEIIRFYTDSSPVAGGIERRRAVEIIELLAIWIDRFERPKQPGFEPWRQRIMQLTKLGIGMMDVNAVLVRMVAEHTITLVV